MGLFDFFKKNKPQQDEKLEQSLEKTKTGIFSRLTKALVGKSRIDDEVLDELEETLLLCDVGVDTTVKIINRIRDKVAKEKYTSTDELDRLLRGEIAALLLENNARYNPDQFNVEAPTENGQKVPYVMLVVGVNGVGKTTTIGKLAHQFKSAGLNVVLGAADTFRAAAVAQLKVWGERAGVPVVDKGMDIDPSSVAYEAVREGKRLGADIVIIDTAGRLHNKKNLMEQLGKMHRVIQKELPSAPHEVLLVLDASTGQNALQQAQEFTTVTNVTALALTKLDGTAKGGVVIGIADKLSIPVKFVGVGEGMLDLQLFDPRVYVDSLFGGGLAAAK